MVISTVNQVVYNGDGVTTAWPYTFRIIDATDIKLTIIDADGTETDVTADYFVDTVNNTVYYPGYAPGAEPPLADQPPKVQTGQKLVVYRELPITQEKNLGDKWPFYVIELALDKLTMILQQIFDWWGRTLKVSLGKDVSDDVDLTVPMQPDTVIAVNNSGTGFESREALMEVNGYWDGEGRQIKSVADPVLLQDAATKKYVDDAPDSVKYRIYEYIDEKLAGSGDGTWQYDHYLDLMPTVYPVESSKWDIDANGDIMPKLEVA